MNMNRFESGRMSEECVEINRLLERCLKESKCLDLESLCIVSEEKVGLPRDHKKQSAVASGKKR
jgi:exosome complex RNA-binding protein Rrp42 (RNase PH superfamily)